MTTLETTLGTLTVIKDQYGYKFGRCNNFTFEITAFGQVYVKDNFEPIGDRGICAEAVLIFHIYTKEYLNAWPTYASINESTETELKKMVDFFLSN